MKLSSLVVAGFLGFAVLGLNACDKGGNGFNKANVSSFELSQMDTLDKSLDKDGIVIDQSGENTNSEKNVREDLSDSDLQTIHAQLTRYISLGNDASQKIDSSKSPKREQLMTSTQIRVAEAQAWLTKVEQRMAGDHK